MDGIKTKTISITLTEKCNLNCKYCYEKNKTDRSISFEKAKEIVDKEIESLSGFDRIEFDLFGGEPFLEFELITAITEYICEKRLELPYTIFISTNGTLVHGYIQEWLRDHKNCLVCGLSVDGTRQMHNLNRSNSYDSIDLDFFYEVYPDQDVKMTISQETLPQLSKGVIDLHQHGFMVSCNLAYGIDWSSDQNKTLLERELNRLIDYYISHPEANPCSILDLGLYNVNIYEEKCVRQCGVGNEMGSYDVDGVRYPCQFFMPLSIGKEKAEISKTIRFPDMYIEDNLLDTECRKCVIKSICPNCIGANFSATGNLYKRDMNMCILNKITIKACSYFKALQWENGLLKDEEDMESLLNAIVKIQERLEV